MTGSWPPTWTEGRVLKPFWFPVQQPLRPADAVVHDPAACRRFGERFRHGLTSGG
jgi:hypothetical protein